MNFGSDFGKREGSTGGGSKFPECKGYKFVITNVEDTVAKSSGAPMMVFTVDIAEGEFAGFFAGGKVPFVTRATYGTDDALDRLKGTLDTIIGQNQGLFPEPEIDWTQFNEKRLIGATVGGVLKWNDRGYLEFHYFCELEEALGKEPIPRPEQKIVKDKGDTGSTGGLF